MPGSCQARDSATSSRGDPVVPEVDECEFADVDTRHG